ncbi:YSC84-related protein [Thiomicrorhabdus aquaedulcis]|uniref:lipid-binding SYLF domain-containing protein n=1 Tax=Thiomicrorhabdus aquaedulcis TaxID=2211106 RepID=UPI0018D4F5A9|nr:lipid-binding SYLF domain-containing protein [Thiomicrorhabdus aquaedulcis]
MSNQCKQPISLTSTRIGQTKGLTKLSLNGLLSGLLLGALSLSAAPALANNDYLPESKPQMTQNIHDAEYDVAVAAFKNAKSGAFFKHAYGYAVFPTIGKVGFFVGGAYGKGRVFERGRYKGDAELFQGSLGFQFGGQAFSQIIFFQDQRAFDEFTSGNFEFGATASAVVITAGVAAEATTKGTSASANLGNDHLKTEGQYYKGMAVFTLAKGGLMYEAAIGGQKFTYTPRAR